MAFFCRQSLMWVLSIIYASLRIYVKCSAEPKYLGSGSYACAFGPAFQCSNMTISDDVLTDSISKVFIDDPDYKYSEDEWWTAQLLLDFKVDPNANYVLYARTKCLVNVSVVVAADKGNKCTAITSSIRVGNHSKILPHNQKEIVQLLLPDGKQKMGSFFNSRKENSMKRRDLLRLFENLFHGLDDLIKHQLVHQDIKLSNIVFPPKDKKPRFIDVGMMTTFSNFYSSEANEMIGLSGDYHLNPPEYRIVHHLRRNNSILSMDPLEYLKKHELSVIVPIKKRVSFETQYMTKTVVKEFSEFFLAFRDNYAKAKKEDGSLDPFEFLQSIHAHLKSDIFSMGVLLFELEEYLVKPSNDDPRTVELFYKLLSGMLHPSPVQRLPIKSVVSLVKAITRVGHKKLNP